MMSCSFFFLLLLLSVSATMAIEKEEKEEDEEKMVLLGMKAHLRQTPDHDQEEDLFLSWLPTSPKCNFTGITCNNFFSVISIDLSNRNLAGTLAFDQICAHLPHLQKLSLGYNSLHGPISPYLNNCTNLNYLDLGNNLFSSSTFPPIPSLTHLTHLHLNLTGLSGLFPFHSLLNMTTLHTLSLGDNPFLPSPFPSPLLNLPSLHWLYLSNSSLFGPLPSFNSSITITNLELADNRLSGPLPTTLSLLTNLFQLELYDNFFTGSIPSGFSNLTSLNFLDASNNLLTGGLSPLKTLTSLVSLQLFQNSFTGSVPTEFGGFKSLVNLSLYMNNLSGPLPRDLGSWAGFNFIDVSENSFTGEIPPDMCKHGAMQKLLMIENRLTGEIPASYCNCTSLSRIRVKSNKLSGILPPCLLSLPKVALLDLRMNRLHGSITPEIGRAASLAQLLASDNLLSGPLPPQISKASSLVSLDLDNNLLSGPIPDSIHDLKSLSRLHLQNNKFSGVIPESLGLCTSMEDLNLAGNSISGEIPLSLASLPSLNSLNISRNSISGEIPARLASLGLILLDLSTNRLTGPIPKGLSIEAYNGSFNSNPGLCSSDVKLFMPCTSDVKTPKAYLAIMAALIAVVVILFTVLGCFMVRRRRTRRREEEEEGLRGEKWDLKSYQVLSFTEEMIIRGIKEGNLIGRGGSGNVYRVDVGEGKELAVKHIWHEPGGGGGVGGRKKNRWKEFEAEVEALSCIRHVNIVKLYCSISSSGSSLLVYELMSNGSLWEMLHSSSQEDANMKKKGLDWESRYEIALGAAKGLEYLHHGCERGFIHRDVKSSNILLDQFLKPRIADFGLARKKGGGEGGGWVIQGTAGYIAPECGYRGGRVDERCDVYGFGVVLIEIVTGKKAVGEREYGEDGDIVRWVLGERRSGGLEGAVDGGIVGEGRGEDGVKVLRIGILCTATLPQDRPTMRDVVKMIQELHPSPRLLHSLSKPPPPPFLPASLSHSPSHHDGDDDGDGM